MKTKIILASLFATFVGLQSFAADSEKRAVYKKIETDNGNTVQVRKKAQTDGEGNARAKRQYRVTDAEGEVVARDKDRARKDDKGKTARAKRQGRKMNEAGEVRARGRDRGQKNAEGERVRGTQKQWTDSRGNRHAKQRARKSQAR